MSEHEQHETDELEDLEPAAEDEEQVIGGAVSISDIPVTKYVDKASTKLGP
jgi:type VI protein secretion system component Hcp